VTHPLLGRAVKSERELTPVRSGGFTGKVGSFGPTRVHADGSPKMHKGVDLLCPERWPVFAAHGGTVERAGWEHQVYHTQGYGMRVRLVGKEAVTVYAHLSELFVVQDQVVAEGDVIGRAGRTGNIEPSTPTHLHFELHLAGGPVDPEANLV
jgi:murein DD-endopeptidase MepM/ murein hydrolase activator NlpD